MKLERSIIRGANGDRTIVELDPEAVRRMLAQGERFLRELRALGLGRPAPRRRARRRLK